MSLDLPPFPWDELAPIAEAARAHPDGAIDLSMGTPTGPTPEPVQAALAHAANAPGYPTTLGTPQLRAAVVAYLERRFDVHASMHAVLPTIGLKEVVAHLPQWLTVTPSDTVAIPTVSYPTYEVGARLIGADIAHASEYDDVVKLNPETLTLVWLNSPSNPTGRVMPPDEMRRIVAWCRKHRIVVASDECYLEFGPRGVDSPDLRSVLHDEVCEGSHDGLIALHSLSKRSQMAGYRAGFIAGDPELIAAILYIRKHTGMIVPTPVQAAMVAALTADAHADEFVGAIAARREQLSAVLRATGWCVRHSAAGMYVWASRRESCWETARWCAERGVLVSPGSFYGEAGAEHVRFSLARSDDDIARACTRLT